MNAGRSSHASPNDTALVLGDDYRMVLPIVRSLGRRGVAVDLGWCDRASPAAASRYARRIHELPWYSPKDSRWIGALDQLIGEHRFSLVIPATEHAVFALQHARRQLKHAARVYLIDDEAFRAVADKQATYGLCERLRIHFPRSRSIAHPDEFERLADELGLPLIVKPRCSVSGQAELGKDYVRVCHARGDALAYVRYLHARGVGTLLQQHCPGEGVGVELLAKRGEVLVALQHRRLHETTGHGSTYRETVVLDRRLFAACAGLMRALDYTGVAMVEFRVDSWSGRWALLEVNGRFWDSLPLATAAGIDFPAHLFDMLVHGRTRFDRRYRAGVRSRALANDIRWLWRRLSGRGKVFDAAQAHTMGWAANAAPLGQVIHDTWRGLSLQDHVDTFAWDDMAPARREIGGLIKDSLASLWAGGIRRRLGRIFWPSPFAPSRGKLAS
jgi:predicted ATP-grasp superfamily ATP-dependent carboligase